MGDQFEKEMQDMNALNFLYSHTVKGLVITASVEHIWGHAMKEFLKTTIIGGALFLLPVALVLLVLNHALQLAGKVVRPISHNLHFDRAVTEHQYRYRSRSGVAYCCLVRRGHRRPHQYGTTYQQMVRKLLSGRSSTIPDDEKHG